VYTGHPQRNRARLSGLAFAGGEWSAAVGRAPRVDPSVVTMSQHSYGMYGGGGGGASRRRAPGINVRQVRQLTLWGRDGLAWTVVCVGGMSRDTRRHCLALLFVPVCPRSRVAFLPPYRSGRTTFAPGMLSQ
jgi:hypothetical protein